jgi:hypothetical protein
LCDSPRNTPTRSGRIARTPALAAVAALAATLGGGGGASASIPAGPPVFTTPLAIDNTFFPLVPGAVRVFGGREQGTRTTVVDIHRADTRDFVLVAVTVKCRVLQETEFEDGALSEISVNYFAQSDDGSVWYFGEVVDEYEDGSVVGHSGSWLVGGPAGGDPPETMTVAAPGRFMPADPETGDEFVPEDLADGSSETDTIARVGRKVRTPAGQFAGCIEVGELQQPDSRTETKWYAPGQGVVKAKGKHEVLLLEASSLPR